MPRFFQGDLESLAVRLGDGCHGQSKLGIHQAHEGEGSLDRDRIRFAEHHVHERQELVVKLTREIHLIVTCGAHKFAELFWCDIRRGRNATVTADGDLSHLTWTHAQIHTFLDNNPHLNQSLLGVCGAEMARKLSNQN